MADTPRTPVGTPDELRALGLGPELNEWVTCAQPGTTDADGQKVKGCVVCWKNCPFTQTRLGRNNPRLAFRGQGPKFVKVRQINAGNGVVRIEEKECFIVAERVWENKYAGTRADPGSGILWQPMGVEGDPITVVDYVSAKPGDPTSKLEKRLVTERTVRHFPRPGEPGSKVSQDYVDSMEALEGVGELDDEEQVEALVGEQVKKARRTKLREGE